MQLFYPGQPSVLQAEMLVKWKRERGLYNFESLPLKALICVDYSICKHLDSPFAKKIKGLKGRNFVAKNVLFCTGFDNGGPGIITLMEELRALGIKQFFFIGHAGRLTKSTKEGDIFAIDKAISGSGVTEYYSESEENTPYDTCFFKETNMVMNCEAVTCISVDSPFRETRPLLDSAVADGACLIEMECSSIYAFGTFYQLPTVCFLMATDSLIEKWQPPVNYAHIQNELIKFVSKLVISINRT